jgi:hypothetical protein
MEPAPEPNTPPQQSWTGLLSWHASYPLCSAPTSVRADACATLLSGDPCVLPFS